MFSTISMLATTLALNVAPMAPPVQHGQNNNCGFGCGGGLLGDLFGIIGDDDDDGEGGIDIDLELGDCLGVDIEVGAKCGIVAGVDALLECDPLSVEAACIAELGLDCGLEAFAACTAELTAHCKAEVEAGGALFCDGHFIGGDNCLGGIDVDVDIDGDACVDVDLGGDIELDLDLGLCLDLDLDLNLDCEVYVDAECHAKCDPIAVQAECEAELGLDCELHEYAACQAEVMADCHAKCDVDGALFCDGYIYAGADICLGLGIGLGL